MGTAKRTDVEGLVARVENEDALHGARSVAAAPGLPWRGRWRLGRLPYSRTP
jgi:hypothetical protein